MGTHVPYAITQCYLPPGRDDILKSIAVGERALQVTKTKCITSLQKWQVFMFKVSLKCLVLLTSSEFIVTFLPLPQQSWFSI